MPYYLSWRRRMFDLVLVLAVLISVLMIFFAYRLYRAEEEMPQRRVP